MRRIIANGAACLALGACATPVAAPPPLRPIVTYTMQQPVAAVTACLSRAISRVAVFPSDNGLRVMVENIPGTYALIYSSVDGARAEIYETAPTQGGVFRVALDHCEATLPRPR